MEILPGRQLHKPVAVDVTVTSTSASLVRVPSAPTTLLYNEDGEDDSSSYAAEPHAKLNIGIKSAMRRSRPAVSAAPPVADGQEDAKEQRPAIASRRSQTQPSQPLPMSNKTKSPTEASHPHHAATFPVAKSSALGKNSLDGGESEVHSKEKKKGVSFLSRFIGTNKKKGTVSDDEVAAGHEEEEVDERPEGMEAQLFEHNLDGINGIQFNPKFLTPPPYIKFRAKYKKEKEFDRVFLAQELKSGRDRAPRRTGSTLNSPTLQSTPLQSDENAIWALEFSKDGKYLAAGGQDKIVRVWAVLSTPEERRVHEEEEDEEAVASRRLRLEAPVFQKRAVREYEGHEGAVIDLSWSKNNFLLSASADKTVRLWHPSRAECLCTFKHTEHVCGIAFNPRDDRFFLAGSRDMKLRFWSIPDKSVAFWQQLSEVITAVSFTPDGKTAIAGTINGVCNFYETEGLKYQTQIHVRSAYGKNAKGSKICSIQTVDLATSEKADVKMLISSNDSRVRLYNFRDKSLDIKFKGHKSEERTIKAQISDDGRYIISGSEDKGAYIWSTGPSESEKPTQRPVEFFEATTSQTTCAILAPSKARQLLSQSEDPIYDLCNPPPVTLLSRSESAASSRAATEPNTTPGTPRTNDSPHKKVTESPAYIARSAHPGGQLIVTASSTGVIRVYRQDCAFTKRKSNEDNSSIFGGKRPSSIYMARAMSRSSAGGNARGSRSDSTSTQPPEARILSWRQGVSSTQSLDRNNARQNSDAKSTRSISPSKSGYSFHRSSSIRRSIGNGLTEMTPKNNNNTSTTPGQPTPKQRKQSREPGPQENPALLPNGQSLMAWNAHELASQALPRPNDGLLHVGRQESKQSIVSTLSSEEEQLSDAAAAAEENACTKCGGKGLIRMKSGKPFCRRCGKAQ